tara:strand:+ start:2124 stop:2759 length:636 start_codon:yes stop_codon:yes gene_type:complete
MIYTLFGFNFIFDISLIQEVLFCTVIGSYFRILLIIVNRQNWLKTYSQVINFAILPAIGFLITSVISSSISLSLGMVGALSIIRFRTPVKNPIELVTYFLLLTVGIVSNVNPNLTLNFAFFMTFVLILLSIYERFVSKSKIFNLFEEGDVFILSIESNGNLDLGNLKKGLVHFSKNQETYLYRISSNNQNNLFNFVENLDESKIISYSIDK